jgi:CII-binding regulator of phage lambda lysogenization HflD
MDARIDALELETRETRATLARIDLTLMRIEERMATKDDIAAVNARISALELSTKADLAALALSTKTDISALAERVAKVEGMVEKLPTTLQLLGFIVALVFTVMGGAFGIVRLLHP